MNAKRFALAVVAVFITMWLLSLLIYDVLFVEQTRSLMALFRPEAEMTDRFAWIIIGHFAQTIVFCYIFLQGYENKGVMEGVRFGLLMGLFLASVDVTWYAALPIEAVTSVVWVISDLVLAIAGGAVLAAVYRPADAA